MKNAEYWANRMRILDDSLLDTGYDYVKNLEKQYDIAITELDKKISAWYQRFMNNNELSYSDAKKLLNSSELAEFKWTVEQYVENGRENALSSAWIKELENASARVHISRLESLQLQLRQEAEALHGTQLRETEKLLENVYREGYYHTAFEVQKGLGVGWSMQSLSSDTLKKVLARPWTTDGQTFRDRCWTNKNALVNSVNTQLTQMIMRGEAPDKAIKAIAHQFGVSKSKAGRLIMTESAAFSSAAQKDCFNDLDIKEYSIVGTLDKDTCQLCGSLDGKVFKMSEYAVGVAAPPFHPWCRCCTAPYFADMEGVSERYARDVKTGDSFTVPRDMTYEQWKEMQDTKYGAGTIDKMWKMRYNEKADREQWALYKDVLGKNAPRTFAEFQSIKYGDDYKSFKAYSRDIKSGELSPFSDFELYKTTSAAIDSKLVNLTTSNGLTVSGKSDHFIARVIGSVEQRRSGVEIDTVIDALKNPKEICPIKVAKNGRSQKFKGNKCYVVINPDTGVLIQTNPH